MHKSWVSMTVRNVQDLSECTQLVFTCSKLTIETLEQNVKYVPKLTIKTPERRSDVFIVNFEHI